MGIQTDVKKVWEINASAAAAITQKATQNPKKERTFWVLRTPWGDIGASGENATKVDVPRHHKGCHLEAQWDAKNIED